MSFSPDAPLEHSLVLSSVPADHLEPDRTRKHRRERPHIELAPDQPLTTQGKPRARVYVACLQCRTRKIRCDGAKPICHNCARRGKPADPCTYDAAPKRRGPDKVPGARQRMSRDAREEADSDPIASRRRRRSRRSTTPPQPPRNRPLPTPVPLTQQPLVLDPQLADMPPIDHRPPTSPPPMRKVSPLLPSAPPISDPSPVLPDDTLYHITNSQGLRDHLSSSLYVHHHPPTRSLVTASPAHAFISLPQIYDSDTHSDDSPDIPPEPSLDFARQTWWESLLITYYSSFPLPFVPMSKRQHAANRITSDLRFLLRYSNYWFSFINVPRFLSIYFDPGSRLRMQPSLLPAALAISTFFQSSEAGLGKQGRRKAMRLRDMARGALEASLNARWIDEELAQAAWLLALFEVCAHPDHTSERCASALLTLDTIIRALSLTLIDMEDPASTNFSPRSVPSVMSTSQYWTADPSLNYGVVNTHSAYGCSCVSQTLGHCWAGVHEYTPLWTSSPAWDDTWSDAEIRKETCRRLCWSTLLLTAGHTSYVTSTNQTPLDLFVLEPANFALLFPAETLCTSVGYSGKDAVWSLNYRIMLLWHSCLRMRQDPSVSEHEMARFAVDAWVEAGALEKALDSHVCDLERSYLFQGRECLFNVRLIVMHEFRRYAPNILNGVGHIFRKQTEDWLSHQASVAQRAVQSLGAVTGNASHALVYRPFFVFWFMSQISRALSLWECDKSLTLALDVGAALFEPVDYLSTLWPCPEQRRRSQRIRGQLATVCRNMGRPLPPPSALATIFPE